MRQNKKVAGIAVVAFLLFAFSQFSASAQVIPHDIATASIIINDNGDYVVFGTSSGTNVITVTGGQPSITLSSLTIPATSAPAIDIQSGDVTLILDSANVLSGGVGAGGIGLAGIRVAAGASLTISAESLGSLTVTGGNGTNAVGAAGIGSNGGAVGFGTIAINGGAVTATGGSPVPSTSATPGAGAGIGTGGAIGNNLIMTGTIEINGGTVIATGGNGNTASDSLGGAGIGSGSVNTGADNLIEISITGGEIAAQGGLDSAGIGGGANIPSGPIFIGGTGDVQAFGRSSGGSFGGAGIGGGDNGFTQGITITGNSNVLAVGAGTAAGIGGGYTEGNFGGEPGENFSYTISGDASVVAVGGSTAVSGGAGIGSGYIQFNFGSLGGVINILDFAKVEAYGGIGANAIGNGRITATNPTNDPAVITISNTARVKAFTADLAQPALNQNTTIEPPAVLYSYTGTPIPFGPLNATDVTTPSGLGLTWFWTNGATPTVNVSDGVAFSANGLFRTTIYNWAFLGGAAEPVPVITSDDHTTFTEGVAGSFQVVATNFPTSYAITGALPAGVTFDTTTGELSGTPAAGTAGTYPLVITATNGAGASEPQAFTLTVASAAIRHTIVASAGQHGIISPVGDIQVTAGSSQTFTISPDQGYVIDTLTVDGQVVTATTSFTFTNVQANHTIHVTFKLAVVPTPKPPKTGDSAAMLWPALGSAALLVGLSILVYKKRKFERE